MIKNLLLLFLFFLIGFTKRTVLAQDCPNAGQDITICGLEFEISGSPAGGSWSYLCSSGAPIIQMDSTAEDIVAVKVPTCGEYQFVYSLDVPGCPGSDTVTLKFENTDYAERKIDFQISLNYQNPGCHSAPRDSCGPIRSLNGLIAPLPIWNFRLDGDCKIYKTQAQFQNPDSSLCIASIITFDTTVTEDSSFIAWTTSQNSFIDLDSEKRVSRNRLNSFIGILNALLKDELDKKCKPEKCFFDPLQCGDTTVTDTILAIVPVHQGGSWHYIFQGTPIPLGQQNEIQINGKNFFLDLPKGSDYYGPETLYFELYSNDGQGQRQNLQSVERIQLQWIEHWIYDTVEYYHVRETSDVNCDCGGIKRFFDTISFPPAPTFICSPIELIFAPKTDPEIIGNQQYCQGEFTELRTKLSYTHYQWSNSITDSVNLISSPGLVSVLVEDSRGCFGADSVNIHEIKQPSLEVEVDRSRLCRGDCTQIRLRSENGNTLIWNNKDSVSQLELCPSVTNFFNARSVDPNGCTHDTLIRIQVFDKPDPNIGPIDVLNCVKDSVELKLSRTDTFGIRGFYWEGPDVDSARIFILNPKVTLPGRYVFTVIDSIIGCTGRDTVEVIEDRVEPVVDAGSDLLINCRDSSVHVSSDTTDLRSGFFWEWIGPGINGANRFDKSLDLNVPGSYILRVTNLQNECVATDTVEIKLDRTPAVADAGPDREMPCDSLVITIGGNRSSSGDLFDIEWTGPQIDTVLKDSVYNRTGSPGNYIIRVRHIISECESIDSMTLSLPDSLPHLILTKSSDLTCFEDSVILDASFSTGENIKFFWAGLDIRPEVQHFKTIVVTKPGKYYILIRDTILNCERIDSIEVLRETANPIINAGLDKTINCDFISVSLDGNYDIQDSLARISWTGPGINSSNQNQKRPVVNLPGTYVFKVFNARNGCESFDTVEVRKVLQIPQVNLGQDRTLSCRQDTIDITAQLTFSKPTYLFDFKGPGILPSQERNQRQVIKIPGVFVARISAPNPECISTDTLRVQIDTVRHSIGIFDTMRFSCDKPSLLFTVNDFSNIDSIAWWDVFDRRMPSNDLGRSVIFLVEGIHRYKVYQKNGCHYEAKVSIQPYVSIVIDRIEVKPSCGSEPNGSIRVLIKSGAGPFRYSVNGSAKDSINFFDRLSTGIYNLRITDRVNCEIDTAIFIPLLYGISDKLLGQNLEIPICKDTFINMAAIVRANGIPLDSVRFEWKEGSRTISMDTLVEFDREGNFTVIVKNRNACDEVVFQLNIKQDPSLANEKISLPNVFTPNGDTENDRYKPVFAADTKFENEGYSLKIYSRWGQLVFESTDPDASWDGNFRDQQSPMDSYIVLLKATLDLCGSGRSVDLKTSLSLIR